MKSKLNMDGKRFVNYRQAIYTIIRVIIMVPVLRTMSQVLRAYGMSLRAWSNQPYVWFAFHWLAISHTCYNPLIYFCMNTRYRAGFVSALRNVPGLGYTRAQQHGDELLETGRPRVASVVSVWPFRARDCVFDFI